MNPHRPHAERRSSLGTAAVAFTVAIVIGFLIAAGLGHLFSEALATLKASLG